MKSPSLLKLRSLVIPCVSLLLAMVLLAAPVCAQRPAAPAKVALPREAAPRAPEPTFDNLLAADSYKMYGEVRNIGQLMSTGGLGEIVDPIIKLAEPPDQFKSIIKFLKTNAEALATARLQFATWRARTFPMLLWRSSLPRTKRRQSLRLSWRHSCLLFCRQYQIQPLSQPRLRQARVRPSPPSPVRKQQPRNLRKKSRLSQLPSKLQPHRSRPSICRL